MSTSCAALRRHERPYADVRCGTPTCAAIRLKPGAPIYANHTDRAARIGAQESPGHRVNGPGAWTLQRSAMHTVPLEPSWLG